MRTVPRAPRTTLRGLAAGAILVGDPPCFADQPRLYHADGQILDEVYDYGSFRQSKMFAAGVTCTDCHEPHGSN